MDLTPQARETKAKVSPWDDIKLKSFFTVNENQLTGWEKIFANHVSDKEIRHKIYKELIKSNNNKTTQLKNGKRN